MNGSTMHACISSMLSSEGDEGLYTYKNCVLRGWKRKGREEGKQEEAHMSGRPTHQTPTFDRVTTSVPI